MPSLPATQRDETDFSENAAAPRQGAGPALHHVTQQKTHERRLDAFRKGLHVVVAIGTKKQPASDMPKQFVGAPLFTKIACPASSGNRRSAREAFTCGELHTNAITRRFIVRYLIAPFHPGPEAFIGAGFNPAGVMPQDFNGQIQLGGQGSVRFKIHSVRTAVEHDAAAIASGTAAIENRRPVRMPGESSSRRGGHFGTSPPSPFRAWM